MSDSLILSNHLVQTLIAGIDVTFNTWKIMKHPQKQIYLRCEVHYCTIMHISIKIFNISKNCSPVLWLVWTIWDIYQNFWLKTHMVQLIWVKSLCKKKGNPKNDVQLFFHSNWNDQKISVLWLCQTVLASCILQEFSRDQSSPSGFLICPRLNHERLGLAKPTEEQFSSATGIIQLWPVFSCKSLMYMYLVYCYCTRTTYSVTATTRSTIWSRYTILALRWK